MATEVYMPKMSDHMEAGEIVRWLVQEGEPVAENQPLLEVMTDKVVAVYEAPAAGVLKGVRPGAREGARVPVGETIAFIALPGEAVPALPPLGQRAAAGAAVEHAGAPRPAPPAGAATGPLRAAPAARALAKALGVDLAAVPGTGPAGRIKVEDVRAFHEAQTSARPAPAVVAATPASPAWPEGEFEWVDLTPVQQVTGQRMLESAQTVPHFTLGLRADMTNALAMREALQPWILAATGERLSLTAILVKVVATALRQHPRVNASFEQGRIKLYRQINVGVAVGNDHGLFVPVIHDAGAKTLGQIAAELAGHRRKAETLRFTGADLSGGTFTISNLGMYGIEQFAAVINPPESAILAVGHIVKTPTAMPDDTIALRPLMSLTLSVDHRSLDGLTAARFLGAVKDALEQPYLLL